MMGFALALAAGGLAIAFAKDRKGDYPTTEAGVTGGGTTGSGVDVNVDSGKPVATMPREGANTPPEDTEAGHSGNIIEMPPMIIERGTQKPAQKPAFKPGGCACVKAPCTGCGDTKPGPSIKPYHPPMMGGKGTATPTMPTPVGGLPFGGSGTGALGTMGGQKPNKPNPIYTPVVSIHTKGLTPTAAGDRIRKEYTTTGGVMRPTMIL